MKSYPLQSSYSSEFLSPNGQAVAVVEAVNSDTVLVGLGRTLTGMQACGWIDDTHVIAGGDLQRQPRVGDATTGMVVPAAAQGVCAGRLPGGLG